MESETYPLPDSIYKLRTRIVDSMERGIRTLSLCKTEAEEQRLGNILQGLHRYISGATWFVAAYCIYAPIGTLFWIGLFYSFLILAQHVTFQSCLLTKLEQRFLKHKSDFFQERFLRFGFQPTREMRMLGMIGGSVAIFLLFFGKLLFTLYKPSDLESRTFGS